MQCTGTIWTTLKEDQPKNIPVKFGRIPISGLGADVVWLDDDDGRWVITIAHLEPSAQVS